MYRILLLIMFAITFQDVYCQSAQVLQLRKEYKLAVKDVKEAENFYHKLAEQKLSDPVEIAYRGASQALMAKNAKGLNKKMSYLKESDKTFASAIQKNATHVEIRFLRFAIDNNLPSFIQNKDRIEEDKVALIENLPKAASFGVGKDFKKEILDYVLSSGKCSAEEEKKLKAMME